MKIYATIHEFGPYTIPIIFIEKIVEYSEGYEDCIGKLYEDIIHNCQYSIFKNNVIIYKKKYKSSQFEFVIKVKEDFIKLLEETNTFIFTLHLFVIDQLERDVEMYFYETLLYSDKVPEKVVLKRDNPAFSIYDKEKGYLSRYHMNKAPSAQDNE